MDKKRFPYITVILTLLVLVLASVVLNGVALENVQEEKTEQTGEKIIKVSLSIDYGDGKVESYSPKAQGGETLFELMHRLEIENEVQLSYKTFPGLGVLIESIGEKKNGEGGAYWQYWINNQYAKVGASEYLPKEGDEILWRYTNQKGF